MTGLQVGDDVVISTAGTLSSIFDAIRIENGMTRALLSRRTGMAPSTVGLKVASLLELGVIREDDRQVTKGQGRPSRSLVVNADFGVIAVFILRGEVLSVDLLDFSGVKVSEVEYSWTTTIPVARLIYQAWSDIIATVSQSDLVPSRRLRGIVVVASGPVRSQDRVVLAPAFMPRWQEIDMPAIFRELTDLEVLVCNDADALALAELRRDDSGASNAGPVLALLLSYRMGGGILIDGRLFSGVSGMAGELGHSWTGEDPVLSCTCGIYGCVESVASGAAVLRVAGQHLGRKVSFEELPVLVATDPEMTRLVRASAEYAGRAVGALVNFISPSRVAVYGELGKVPGYAHRFRIAVASNALAATSAETSIVFRSHLQKALVRGGYERYMANSGSFVG